MFRRNKAFLAINIMLLAGLVLTARAADAEWERSWALRVTPKIIYSGAGLRMGAEPSREKVRMLNMN